MRSKVSQERPKANDQLFEGCLTGFPGAFRKKAADARRIPAAGIFAKSRLETDCQGIDIRQSQNGFNDVTAGTLRVEAGHD